MPKSEPYYQTGVGGNSTGRAMSSGMMPAPRGYRRVAMPAFGRVTPYPVEVNKRRLYLHAKLRALDFFLDCAVVGIFVAMLLVAIAAILRGVLPTSVWVFCFWTGLILGVVVVLLALYTFFEGRKLYALDKHLNPQWLAEALEQQRKLNESRIIDER